MSKIALEGNASGTGTFTIASPNSNSNYTLTLPSSTGTVVVTGGAQTIEFAAGTAAAPSITFTGDTNTGIFSPAADTIAFSEGGAEAMRITSAGNLDIGGSAYARRLSVKDATNTVVVIEGSNAGSSNINFADGDSENPGSINYGHATNYMAFQTAGSERMRIDSSGNVGIGTSSPNSNSSRTTLTVSSASSGGGEIDLTVSGTTALRIITDGSYNTEFRNPQNAPLIFGTNNTERARITSSGDFLVNKTAADAAVVGCELRASGVGIVTASGTNPLTVNRLASDGNLVQFQQDSTTEGTISVSGTTVSYNGGNLARYAQLTVPKDETNLLKGTIMSNLDEMNVYTDAEGNPVPNEQLNKVKVSDVEGDVNVAGVFVNWDYDEAHQVDEINMAMTGDMIIRIAQGVVVQKGDLLMSAGDGTAKPQGDDIVRSKTVAKVTSNHVTCTYADGSYCVPCVLMAC